MYVHLYDKLLHLFTSCPIGLHDLPLIFFSSSYKMYISGGLSHS